MVEKRMIFVVELRGGNNFLVVEYRMIFVVEERMIFMVEKMTIDFCCGG